MTVFIPNLSNNIFGPIPDIWSNCGVLIAPAHIIISLLALITFSSLPRKLWRSQVTEIASLLLKLIFFTIEFVNIVKLDLDFDGFKKAFALEWRFPPLVVIR